MARFTNSRDGIRRTNLHATIRVDADEVKSLRQLAKDEGFDRLSDFLRDTLLDGITAVKTRRDEDAATLAQMGGAT